LKIVLIIVGIAFVILIVISVSRFLNRLGKPVNKTLSDSYYYHARKNIIVYSPMGNWFELGYTETCANRKSFQVLSRDIGKDHRTIFWKGEPQPVDYASFFIDKDGIAKDSAHVYYTGRIGKELQVIAEADPKTYRPYTISEETPTQAWGRDERSFFLYGKKIDVDGISFERINQSLGYDSGYIYAITRPPGLPDDGTQVLKKALNPRGQAESINDFYARIGNLIIHSNWRNEFSSETFESIREIHIIDDRNIAVNNILISDGNRIPDVDIKTLEIVARDYIKDNTSVYFNTHKIPGADPKTFSYVFEDYSKDHKHVYYKTEILPGIEVKNLTADYSSNSISDGKVSFRDGIQLK
jgi:DKNYY family